MQKKLLAVAVAGALAVPGVAMAQSVTVSGALNLWMESAGASGATQSQAVSGASPTTFDVKSRSRIQDGNASNVRFPPVEDPGPRMHAFAPPPPAPFNTPYPP